MDAGSEAAVSGETASWGLLGQGVLGGVVGSGLGRRRVDAGGAGEPRADVARPGAAPAQHMRRQGGGDQPGRALSGRQHPY
ncbi:MAG: hypothetical protein AAFW46_19040, partial [Pseudomonadota bacterium]